MEYRFPSHIDFLLSDFFDIGFILLINISLFRHVISTLFISSAIFVFIATFFI